MRRGREEGGFFVRNVLFALRVCDLRSTADWSPNVEDSLLFS